MGRKRKPLTALPSMVLFEGEWVELRTLTQEQKDAFWEKKMEDFGRVYSEICMEKIERGEPLPKSVQDAMRKQGYPIPPVHGKSNTNE